jgi:chromosome segregation ATPase
MESSPMSDSDYTDDILEKAAASLADELSRHLKSDMYKEVMAPLQNVLISVRKVYESALHDAVTEQDQVVEILKDRLLSQQGAKAELHREIAGLENELETVREQALAFREKKSVEDDERNITMETLQEHLHEAVDMAEAALEEKNLADEKLQLALAIADETEKKFHQANDINRALMERLSDYRQELEAAVTLMETLLQEKNRLEDRLNRLAADFENK